MTNIIEAFEVVKFRSEDYLFDVRMSQSYEGMYFISSADARLDVYSKTLVDVLILLEQWFPDLIYNSVLWCEASTALYKLKYGG